LLKNKIIPLFLIILINAGCTPTYQLTQDYKKIVYFNGISEYEAKTIAEYYLIKSNYKSYYQHFPTRLRNDLESNKYPDYWFVDFVPPTAFDAPSYLVVIRKNDGKVILAKDYWPHKMMGLDWVFKRTKIPI